VPGRATGTPGAHAGPAAPHGAKIQRHTHLYHLRLAVVDDNTHWRLDSRFCTSLADARRVLGRWRDEYAIPAQHLHDNSDIDLDILFAQMDGDREDAAESREPGFIPGPNPADESGLRPRLVVPHPFLPANRQRIANSGGCFVRQYIAAPSENR
jgi:hypothetical protein